MATIHWKRGVNGDFGVAANWNPATVPGSGDVAAIDAAGTYTVTTSANETVQSLDTAAGATLAVGSGTAFTVANGTGPGVNAGTVTVSDNADFDFAGTFHNTGKIKLNAGNIGTSLVVLGSGTLSGGGKVILSDNANNAIFGTSPSDTLTNLDNVIAGAGELDQMTLVNGAKGVIDATGKLNTLRLATGSSPVSNAGILEATGSGKLVISSTVNNTSTGVIQDVGAAAHVFLKAATIVGGTLKTTSGGTVEVESGTTTLDGSEPGAPVNNGGHVVVDDAAFLALSGTVNNSGSITCQGVHMFSDIEVGSGGAALQGGGKVVLAALGHIAGVNSSATLINVNNTIAGGDGEVGVGTMNLVNQAKGVIDATTNHGGLVIDPISATNAGLMEATGGANLNFDNTTVSNAATGVIEAVGSGSFVSLLSATIVGGTLRTISGGVIEVENNGNSLDGSTPSAPVKIAGSVVLDDDTDLRLRGAINNSGSIVLKSVGSATSLLVGSGGAALTGGGKVNLSDNVHNFIADASGNTDTLTNVDNVIAGAGSLAAPLANETKGVIDATSKNNSLLIVANANNAGKLEATGGATLTIEAATITNASTGVIQAVGAGSRVSLLGSNVIGGTLKTASGGAFDVQDVFLDGSKPAAPVNNAGALTVEDNSALVIRGTVNNTGSITLQSTGSNTFLEISTGGAALQGGGKILLSGSPNDFVLGLSSLATLTNFDNTIAGAGALNNMILVNGAKGVIDATSKSSTMLLDTGANAITNSGLIETAAGALGLQIKSTLVNNGKLLAAGGVLLIQGAVSGTGSATIDRGGEIEFGSSLTGITENVTFANVGSGAAALRFDATATSNPNLIYNGVISGFSGSADRIDLNGLAFVTSTGAVTTHLQGTNTILEITEGGNKVDLTLAGNHTADKFVVSNDGTGGTLIVDPPGRDPDLSPLLQAIASFGVQRETLAFAGATPLATEWAMPSMLAPASHHK
jgi:hypothetical protein